MGYKPKSRVYATVSGVQMELFSIRELSSGDLIITLRAPKFFEQGFDDYVPMLQHKITVHVSPDTDGHVFTNTALLEDGDKYRHVSLVKQNGSKFLTHLFSRRYTNFESGSFRLNANPKDTVTCCAIFDGSVNSLAINVAVCHPGVVGEEELLAGKYTRLSFTHFDLIFRTRFIHIPPLHQGDTAMVLTSPSEFRGNPMEPKGDLEAASVTPVEGFQGMMDDFEKAILQQLRHRLVMDALAMGYFGTPLHVAAIAACASAHDEPK